MHYLTLVLTETGSIEEIEEIMAPFDENLEVDPWYAECGCRGSKARFDLSDNPSPEQTALLKEMEKTRGEQRRVISELRDLEPESPDFTEAEAESERLSADLRRLSAQYEVIRQGLLVAHPLYDKIDPECSECAGSGLVEVTYNPEGRWDWFEVGGRWRDYLDGSSAPVDEVIEKLSSAEIDTPFSIITRDRWSNISEIDHPVSEVASTVDILRENSGLIATVVDCHS